MLYFYIYALGWTCAQVLQNCRHQPRYCSAAVNHDRNFGALFDCLDVHCRASSVSRRGVGVRSRASRDTWHVTLGTRPHIPACLCHTHVTVTLSRGANTGNTAGMGHCTAWTQLNISYKKGTNDWFRSVRSHWYLFYKTPLELFCFMTLPYPVRFCCFKWNSNCSFVLPATNMRIYWHFRHFTLSI